MRCCTCGGRGGGGVSRALRRCRGGALAGGWLVCGPACAAQPLGALRGALRRGAASERLLGTHLRACLRALRACCCCRMLQAARSAGGGRSCMAAAACARWLLGRCIALAACAAACSKSVRAHVCEGHGRGRAGRGLRGSCKGCTVRRKHQVLVAQQQQLSW